MKVDDGIIYCSVVMVMTIKMLTYAVGREEGEGEAVLGLIIAVVGAPAIVVLVVVIMIYRRKCCRKNGLWSNT